LPEIVKQAYDGSIGKDKWLSEMYECRATKQYTRKDHQEFR